MRPGRSIFALIGLLGLCGCVSLTQQRHDRDRLEQISNLESWALAGRLALQNANKGGSGSIEWRAAPATERIDFRAALGQGHWRVTRTGMHVTLERPQLAPISGVELEQLVARVVGWPVPVDALRFWVLGVAAPGEARAQRGADGLPERIQQFGWDITYESWMQTGEQLLLPRKLEATRGEFRIKLLVRQWGL